MSAPAQAASPGIEEKVSISSGSGSGQKPVADDDQYSSQGFKEHDGAANAEVDGELKRDLTPGQITMIAIGGAIGTGLVIGTGSALRQGGPASLFISYTLFGLACYVVLTALGEMSAYIPHRRGFSGHGTRFVDPAFGVAMGYNYLFKYLVITPNQLNATAVLISYWRPDISPAVWVSIMLVAIIVLNNLGVKAFGHIEFWMSFGKIVVLTGLIIFALVIDLGGGPSGDRIGFRYWKNGLAFSEFKETGPLGRFIGFWSTLTLALFAYTGSELVAVCVGETKNPRRAMPRAVRTTFIRIAFFYILGSLLIGMTVKKNDPLLLSAAKGKSTAAASPFVIAAKNAGVKVLPSLINACLLLFTISAANSDLYVGSRTLYGLADDGKAPRIFLRCNRLGVPWVANILCILFCGLAYLNVSGGGAQTFTYLTSTVTIFGGLTWIGILITHIRFMMGLKAQGVPRDSLPYKSPFQPFASWFALFFVGIVVLTKGFTAFWGPWNYKSFITHYVGLPLFVLIFVVYKVVAKTSFVPLAEMDLVEGARMYDDLDVKSQDEEVPKAEKVKAIVSRAKGLVKRR